MQAKLIIDGHCNSQDNVPRMTLVSSGDEVIADLDFRVLRMGTLDAPVLVDFLVLAGSVYVLDKMVERKSTPDRWTRKFVLRLPVSNPHVWNQVAPKLTKVLEFLTGDRWVLAFSRRDVDVSLDLSNSNAKRNQHEFVPSAVCLFSGGLDSFVGAVDWLRLNETGSLALVGHHDGSMSGPMSDQERLIDGLKQAYPNRFVPLLSRVGHKRTDSAKEITLRSRSLLFIALGMYVAGSIDSCVPLLIPENGTISVNIPLNPSRRGSCSTRTTHPFFISLLEEVLREVGVENRIHTPLESKTKGEVVIECLNKDLLKNLASETVSCAKRGHKENWLRKSARGCGQCMPCVYRRAALHRMELDNEEYGVDVCSGEVDIAASGKEAPNDFRACLGFLKRNPSARDIQRMLIGSGNLDVRCLPKYAGIVQRAMGEIRNLLEDKATTKIRYMAGNIR